MPICRKTTPCSQYELATLDNGQSVPRRTWLRVWTSVSDPFHPHSQQEWDAYLTQED
jgi:hypothetical protein